MKYTPDGYGERCRFDAFCKTVLRNEARTHLRDLGRQRSRETEFSALSQQEMDKLLFGHIGVSVVVKIVRAFHCIAAQSIE